MRRMPAGATLGHGVADAVAGARGLTARSDPTRYTLWRRTTGPHGSRSHRGHSRSSALPVAESLPSGEPDDGRAGVRPALLKPEERAALEDVEATVEAAAVTGVALDAQPRGCGGAAGERQPASRSAVFVLVEAASAHTGPKWPAVLRGTIDCLVQPEDGSVVVVEFKIRDADGPSTNRQLDLYVEAARGLFPGSHRSTDGSFIRTESAISVSALSVP